MTFEDIDSPVSDDVLSGEGEETPAPVVADNTPEIAAAEVAPEAEKVEKPEPKAEREQVIPRARFDELNAKLHQERQERERLQAELEATRKPAEAPPQDADITAMENEFFEAMMNGEQEKAVSIRSKINAEIFARAEAASVEKVDRNLSEREAVTAIERVAAEVVEKYPFLDSNSPQANRQAIDEVVEWRDFYKEKGFAPAEA